MTSVSIGILVLVAMIVNFASCKIFSKCELARELQRLNMPRAQIPDWICLVESESSMDSRIIGDSNMGLFQINSDYWCGKGRRGGGCNMRCEDLINDDISDDVACAKIIYQDSRGFTPWVGWSHKCNGRSLPDISSCGVSPAVRSAASPVAAQAPISVNNWNSQPKTSWVSQNTNWNALNTVRNTPKPISNVPKTNWNWPNTNWNTPKTNWNAPKTNWNAPKTNWNAPKTNWNAPTVAPPVVRPWRSAGYNVAQYPSQHRTRYFRTSTG